MKADDNIRQNYPFIRYWYDTLVPDILEPLAERLGREVNGNFIRDCTGIQYGTVAHWLGLHHTLAVPTKAHIQRIADGFDLDDDARDELWSSWVAGARWLCENGYDKKAIIGGSVPDNPDWSKYENLPLNWFATASREEVRAYFAARGREFARRVREEDWPCATCPSCARLQACCARYSHHEGSECLHCGNDERDRKTWRVHGKIPKETHEAK